MAPIPVVVPMISPVVTWVVPLQMVPAQVEMMVAVGILAALAALKAGARALEQHTRRPAAQRRPAWHGFRALQA